MKIPRELIENQAYDSRSYAFSKQQPYAVRVETAEGQKMVPIKDAVEVMEDGSVRLSMYAPDACSVEVRSRAKSVRLVKNDEGYWEGVIAICVSLSGKKPIKDIKPLTFGIKC